VVLKRVSKSVIDSARGQHDEYVFVYRGRPIETMHNTGWQEARKRAGLPQVRVHDLKHTFGRRLRAAGVSFEDRQDLLGHCSKFGAPGRIRTHDPLVRSSYCASQVIDSLMQFADARCNAPQNRALLCITHVRKTPAGVWLLPTP